MSPLMRRRPVLRAAAVGGGAYALGKRRAQAREPDEQQPSEPQAPEAPGAGGLSTEAVERLEQLGQLHEQGVLTDDEFNAQKAKLLAG
jgi:Short C-terminal domain